MILSDGAMCAAAALAAAAASFTGAASSALIELSTGPSDNCTTSTCAVGVFVTDCDGVCPDGVPSFRYNTVCESDLYGACATALARECYASMLCAVLGCVAATLTVLLVAASWYRPAAGPGRRVCVVSWCCAVATGCAAAVAGMAYKQHLGSADDDSAGCGVRPSPEEGGTARLGASFWALVAAAALHSALCVVYGLGSRPRAAADDATPLLRATN